MKHLWKVEFAMKYNGIGEWIDGHFVRVVANGDGSKAVAKAAKIAKRHEFEDGDGTWRKCLAVRLVGLEQLAEIDE